jgi:ABC-type transport system involved in cytochrome c biogenesis permease subunit
MNQPARWTLFAIGIALFVTAVLVVMRDAMPPEEARVVPDYEPWTAEVLEVAETIPVQDGGRIKPLSTYAGFTMLRLYGARSMKIKPAEDAEEIRIEPLEWMLDALFRPRFAVRQPSFRVEDSDVLLAIDVEAGERRDRYSYAEIEPGRDRLLELARTYSQGDREPETSLEKQIVSLATNVQSYEHLLGVFGLAKSGLVLRADESGSGPRRANASDVMVTAPMIRDVLSRSQAENQGVPPHIRDLLQQILDGANASKFGLFVFPPLDDERDEWMSPGERVMNVMTMQTRDIETAAKDIELVEAVSRNAGEDPSAFLTSLKTFRDEIVARAKSRDEYRSVPLEAEYYERNWFLYALAFFLLGTVLTIGMWMTPATRIGQYLSYGVWATCGAGLLFTVIPIVKRSIIMQRPPVGNLYDTIIFITAAVVIFGAIVELLTKRKFALGLMAIAGVCLILLARLFEVGDGSDHMDPLVAVLRSNYWLTTHVITITLGYAGGLVTALLGMVYVMLRGLRLDGGDKGLRRSLTRSVYGMVCFTLFLSLVGTVLGGIWANDSWGRFWGWDPKENGALMIVLANLAILHARMGGFIREWGLHLSAILMAAIVTFSWWGVNLLGEGLHSYGFADGGSYINLVYGLIGVFLLFGFVAKMIEKAGVRKDSNEVVGPAVVEGES